MKTKHVVIPVFIPHKGCPFDCIYCNQKTISGQMDEMTEEQMRKVIESHIATLCKDDFVEIGFYGGSFTGIEKDQQINFLKVANEYIKKGIVKEIRLSTRPDYINHEILKYLKVYNVNTIELGVQSLDNEVLKESNRGHTANDVIVSSNLIGEYGFNLGIQTMIGLPGDNKDKDIQTAKEVVALLPGIVRIYPALVIKGTYLEKMFKEGRYIPLELEDAVDICAELLEIYKNNNINVIRIGLQPTDNINEQADVVSGPFHPAFRQLVESKLILNNIEKSLCHNGLTNEKNIVIYTDEKNISNIIGQRRKNIIYLKKKFGFENIIVKSGKSGTNGLCIEKANL